MTLTLPDMISPAQPPTDGRRELLAYLALCVVIYVAGALAFVAGFGRTP